MNAERFHVRLTADFRDADGRTKYPDIGLSVLEAAGITSSYIDRHRTRSRPSSSPARTA